MPSPASCPVCVIVCFGEMLLRLSPVDGQDLATADAFQVHVAGAEANVAISLASLGVASRMATVLPDTPLGLRVHKALVQHGVDTIGVALRPGRMGLFYIGSQKLGREGGVIYDRAQSAFALAGPGCYDWETLLEGAAWLHVSGITAALGDAALAQLRAALAMARILGIQISFDCNFRPALWAGREALGATLLFELAGHADLLFASPQDIAVMTELEGGAGHGADDASRFEASAAHAFTSFPKLSLMASTSRTELGAGRQALAVHLARPGRSCHVPAAEIRPLVDRIGAGDAFAAAVLYGLAGGWEDARIAGFAHRATLLKHGIAGDFTTLSESEVWRDDTVFPELSG